MKSTIACLSSFSPFGENGSVLILLKSFKANSAAFSTLSRFQNFKYIITHMMYKVNKKAL